MITRHRAKTPEPRTCRGEALLTHNHIALLHGLYDRPDGYAESRSAWVRATIPFITRMKDRWDEWGIRSAMLTMHHSWVDQRREGRFISARLTGRGRGIVERGVPTWIRGRGAYTGLNSVDRIAMASRSSRVSDSDIREAVAYASEYGLPLIVDSVQRSDETVYALSDGLDQPFRIVAREELLMRGPQQWHCDWTRRVIRQGRVPRAYLDHFRGCDSEDVSLYLQELQDDDADGSLYLLVYNGRTFLSQAKVDEFLRREIDLAATDFDRGDLMDVLRWRSSGFLKARLTIRSMMAWRHPGTGKPIGSVYYAPAGDRIGDIIVTTPAALSCLQRQWDNTNVGLRIETRYSVDYASTVYPDKSTF